MTDLSMKINGIRCQHCTESIQKALQKLPGISGISISPDYQYIHMRIDKNQISEDIITKTIHALGFEVG